MSRLLYLVAVIYYCSAASAADLMQYGRAYLAEGDNAAAVQSYSEAVRLNPFDPVAHNNLAVAKAASGDYQSALDLLTRAVKLAPNRVDIRDNLSQLQSWMDRDGGRVMQPQVRVGRKVRDAELIPFPALWEETITTTAYSNPSPRLMTRLQPRTHFLRKLKRKVIACRSDNG